MADYDTSALSGLLGQLQPLLAALGPSEEDKHAARMRAIATAGMGMLGTPKYDTWGGIGRGGLMGAQAYSQDLKDIANQRQQSLAQLTQLYPLLQKTTLPSDVWNASGAPAGPPPIQFGMQDRSDGAPAASAAGQQAAAIPLGKQLVNLGYSPELINATIKNSKDPMGDLQKMYLEAAKPMMGAGNIPMLRNPLTGSIDAAPANGYNQALAAQAGAQAAATKAATLPMETMNVPVNGAPTMVPSDIALQRLRQQAGAGAPAPAPQGGFGVGLTPQQEAEQKKRGEDLGAVPAEVASAADSAQNQAARIQEMERLAEKMPFGATTPARVGAAKYALDIPVVGDKVANAFVDNAAVAVPAAQAFGKMASQMVIDQSKQLGTREAASVIQMVANSNPNMAWTRPAAQTAMDYIKGTNRYAEEKQQASQQWLATHNGSSDGFQAAWNRDHPLTAYIPPLDRLESAFKTGTVPDGGAPKLTAAGQNNATIKTIMSRNPTPQQIEMLRQKGYLE